MVAPQGPVVLEVAAQLRWHTLEAVQRVVGDDLPYLVPAQHVVLVVGRAEDALVLGAETAQRLGTLVRPFALGYIHLPVRQGGIHTAHGCAREWEGQGANAVLVRSWTRSAGEYPDAFRLLSGEACGSRAYLGTRIFGCRLIRQ